MSPEQAAEFREFVAARSAGLLRTAYFLTGGDVHAAQDLLQTALMATARHWGNIRRQDRPEVYVRRAMARHQINWWRAMTRRRETLMAAVPESPSRDYHADVDLRHGLVAALRELPPGQRTVVVLRYYEDRSETEVAEMLNVSVGTVRSQTAKAVARLRARYVDAAPKPHGVMRPERNRAQ